MELYYFTLFSLLSDNDSEDDNRTDPSKSHLYVRKKSYEWLLLFIRVFGFSLFIHFFLLH